jgi:hypothetical protein
MRKNSKGIEEKYSNFEEEEQNGFRTGRSYTDNICYLKHIIKKKMKKEKSRDITKVYLLT